MAGLHLSKSNLMRGLAITTLSVLTFSIASPAIALASTGEDAVVTNHNDAVTASETSEALQSVPGILGASDQVTVTTDGDSAIVATTAGAVVDVPTDPELGVTLVPPAAQS